MKIFKYIHFIAASFSTLCIQNVYAQNYLSNGYLQNEIIKVGGITSDNQIYNLTPAEKQTTREYYDGLGRVVQSVAIQASPLQKDIIKLNSYNSLGIQTREYLPYVAGSNTGAYRTNSISEQAQFYSNGITDKVADDNSPFSEQVIEASPLQRVLISGNIGEGFQPGQHYKSSTYRSNIALDAVINWGKEGVHNGIYANGVLSVTEYIDELNHSTLVFKDIKGNAILKRNFVKASDGITNTSLDTYYVYNNIGQIIYAISPKAVSTMRSSGNWSLSQSLVMKLIFKYVYDSKGRLIEKTAPNQLVTYIIYDPMNRPVLSQDGMLRGSNKWKYIKYDFKGRVISGGLYTNAVNKTRESMQSLVDGLNFESNFFEERVSSSTTGYYSNTCFPTANIESFAYHYFDDYDLDQNGQPDYTYISQGLNGESVATSLTRGMPTISTTRTVGAGLNNIWLTNIIFYNKHGNIIQRRSNNQLGVAINDSDTMVPDFVGRPKETKTIKKAGSSTTSVKSVYSYDSGGRITAIDQSYNGATSRRIAAYEYNEIGQLVRKKLNVASSELHNANVTLTQANSVASGVNRDIKATKSITLVSGFTAAAGSTFRASITAEAFLQAVDYRYNIRGSLTSINNSTLTVDDKNEDSNDLFGMEISYEKVDATLNNVRYYNGMVSAVKWQAKTSTPIERSYKFTYDDQDRLINAVYGDRSSGSANWGNVGRYDEKNVSYDENGNILTLQRTAMINGTISGIDDLKYTYEGNQLKDVQDNTGADYRALGFRNITGSIGTNYSYDNTGNLTGDPKKGLNISYNAIGKTDKVTIAAFTGRYLNYTYNSSGSLIRKQEYNNSVLQKTTDYIDGFVYENESLVHFLMPEGRVKHTGATLKAEYVITDQQGNARVSFTEENGVAVLKQENSYYPFGLIMPNSPVATPTGANKNLYNGGAEWQNDFGDLPDLYHTFYREYDAALGRFTGVDPMADTHHSVSGYQYALNNPLSFNDPLGDTEKEIDEEGGPGGGAAGGRFGFNWTRTGGFIYFATEGDAFQAGANYISEHNSWGLLGTESSYRSAADAFNRTTTGPHADVNRQSNFIVGFTWNRNSDGSNATVNGVNGSATVVPLNTNYDISANKGGDNWVDNLQTTLDIAGIADPTGAADLLNAAIYAGRGQWGNAGISAMGILPYIGDIGKAGRLGSKVLNAAELARIQNAATRIGKPINVVGSRASGTAKATSDWDYVIEGMTNKQWKQIKNSLPGAGSRIDNMPRMIDIFKGPVDPTKPFITIFPK